MPKLQRSYEFIDVHDRQRTGSCILNEYYFVLMFGALVVDNMLRLSMVFTLSAQLMLPHRM